MKSIKGFIRCHWGSPIIHERSPTLENYTRWKHIPMCPLFRNIPRMSYIVNVTGNDALLATYIPKSGVWALSNGNRGWWLNGHCSVGSCGVGCKSIIRRHNCDRRAWLIAALFFEVRFTWS